MKQHERRANSSCFRHPKQSILKQRSVRIFIVYNRLNGVDNTRLVLKLKIRAPKNQLLLKNPNLVQMKIRKPWNTLRDRPEFSKPKWCIQTKLRILYYPPIITAVVLKMPANCETNDTKLKTSTTSTSPKSRPNKSPKVFKISPKPALFFETPNSNSSRTRRYEKPIHFCIDNTLFASRAYIIKTPKPKKSATSWASKFRPNTIPKIVDVSPWRARFLKPEILYIGQYWSCTCFTNCWPWRYNPRY